MKKSYLLSFLLLSVFYFISCSKESPLSPEVTTILNSLKTNSQKVSDKIADENTILKRRKMLGDLFTDNELASDTLIIVERFGKGPSNVYKVDMFNTKEHQVVSYVSENKRTSGRKKNIIQGEYEMQKTETLDENVELIQTVAKKGIKAVTENKSKLSMLKSIKSTATIVSLLIKKGDSYTVESEEK